MTLRLTLWQVQAKRPAALSRCSYRCGGFNAKGSNLSRLQKGFPSSLSPCLSFPSRLKWTVRCLVDVAYRGKCISDQEGPFLLPQRMDAAGQPSSRGEGGPSRPRDAKWRGRCFAVALFERGSGRERLLFTPYRTRRSRRAGTAKRVFGSFTCFRLTYAASSPGRNVLSVERRTGLRRNDVL